MATANTALNRPRGPALISPQAPPPTTHATFCAPLFSSQSIYSVKTHRRYRVRESLSSRCINMHTHSSWCISLCLSLATCFIDSNRQHEDRIRIVWLIVAYLWVVGCCECLHGSWRQFVRIIGTVRWMEHPSAVTLIYTTVCCVLSSLIVCHRIDLRMLCCCVYILRRVVGMQRSIAPHTMHYHLIAYLHMSAIVNDQSALATIYVSACASDATCDLLSYTLLWWRLLLLYTSSIAALEQK